MVVVRHGFSDACDGDGVHYFVDGSKYMDNVETRVTRLEEQVITLFKNFESVDRKLDNIEAKFDKELRVAMMERLVWLGVIALISYLGV